MNEEEALHMHLNVLETPLENLDIILKDIYKENKTISSSTDNKQSLNNYIAYQKYKIFNSEYINRQIDNEYKNLEEVTIATEKKNEELESQLKSIEQEKVNLIQTKVNMEEQIKTLEDSNNYLTNTIETDNGDSKEGSPNKNQRQSPQKKKSSNAIAKVSNFFNKPQENKNEDKKKAKVVELNNMISKLEKYITDMNKKREERAMKNEIITKENEDLNERFKQKTLIINQFKQEIEILKNKLNEKPNINIQGGSGKKPVEVKDKDKDKKKGVVGFFKNLFK